MWKSTFMSQFTSAGSQQGTDQTQEKNRCNKAWVSRMVPLIAATLLLTTLVCLLLVTTGRRQDAAEGDTKDDALNDFSDETPTAPTTNPPTVPTINPPSTSSTGKSEATTSSSSGTTTAKQTTTTTKATTTTTSTTTTRTPENINKRVTNESMICTVDCGRFINLPVDGLCDFILFDSLYKCHEELVALSLLEHLADFAKLAASSKQTQYGCSIDAPSALKFTEVMQSPSTTAWIIKDLFSNKLYHWGVINAHEVTLRRLPNLLRNALNALKMVAAFSNKHLEKQKIGSYTFLGCYGSCERIAQDIKNVFMPDAVVVLGHISFGPIEFSHLITGFKCIMLPPNIFWIPGNVRGLAPYAHSFYEGCKLAECLRWLHDIVVPIGVSLTLKGRLFEPKSDDETATPFAMGSYDVFKDCNSKFQDHDQAPAVVCNLQSTNLFKNMVWDEHFQTMKSFDRAFTDGNQRLTLAFDNRLTYREKLCTAKYNLTHVTFSVVAYDVNFDSDEGTCPRSMLYGVFNRTVMLRRFSTYLNKKYDKYKHNDCLKYQ